MSEEHYGPACVSLARFPYGAGSLHDRGYCFTTVERYIVEQQSSRITVQQCPKGYGVKETFRMLVCFEK
jgi:hypothetical protein